MKVKLTLCMIFCSSILALTVNSAFGQLLYSENFDDGMASTRWQANLAEGLDLTVVPPVSKPMDTNFDLDGDLVVDDTSGFSFDYSTVGIPAAPNSGGTTLGMKLQANLFSDSFGGFSVSPLSQNFTGDYVLSYDMWQNFNGPLDSGFAGTTQISYGGIMSSGTSANKAGASDGVFFASTLDGQNGSDYRAYSFERPVSYQLPVDPTVPADLNATYFAGSRNNTADLYRLNINPEPDPVGAPGVGGVSAPAAQLALYPQQTGTVVAGSTGFAWYHHEITKMGDVITWSVDGLDLIEVDLTTSTGVPGGGNILFGHSDTNGGSSTDFNAQFLLFSLVDNVEVNAISSSTEDADFDGDGDVDGRDFLTWQRGFGIDDGTAQLADGDANDDGNVDGLDLPIWQAQYGEVPLVATVAVPEPTTLASLFGAIAAFLGLSRRSLKYAPVLDSQVLG